MNYARVPHRVVVEKLETSWTWRTPGGDLLTASAGDYRILDPVSGAEWSITPQGLASGYQVVAGDVYESCGSVVARKVDGGAAIEAVLTSEGVVRAHPGDWIVTDDEGNSWVVDADHFNSHYR